MQQVVQEIESALAALGRPSPWGPDLKVTDDFLDRVFELFFQRLNLPNLMRKTDYHGLAEHVPLEQLDPEIKAKLDAIVEVEKRAKPRIDGIA
jgi:hypothetical protein